MSSKLLIPITTMGCGSSIPASPTSRTPNYSNRRKDEEVLLQIPTASVHLTGDSEPIELANGDFTIVRITEDDVSLATVVKVGLDLQWPLTKDEPVIKIDKLHYLFTLPGKDGSFLNYGVSFAGTSSMLDSLDLFLKEHACFSTSSKLMGSKKGSSSYEVYWRDYAPKIDEYNGVLAKAIAQGTGEILKGIFTCSNAYTSQVQKAADLIQPAASGGKIDFSNGKSSRDRKDETNKNNGGINQSIRRVRKLSEMTEKMSQSLLNGVLLVSGSVTAPLVQSKAGKAFFSMLPGEVLLASLDAVGKVLDAVELTERKAFAATSGAVTGVVSKKFGESAGEATEDAFATAGHAIGMAWNVFKIRNALNPKSSVKSSIVRNAVMNKKTQANISRTGRHDC